ncbi:hypothetical protein V2J09_002720, partial [Rumex salicifolius]
DLILFCGGDFESVSVLKNSLDISGLNCNSSKSSIYFGGVPSSTQTAISSLLNFPTGSLPFTYLGLPMGSKKLSSTHFHPLISRITSRIQSWTAKKLSYAGRLQLINSAYWCSDLLIPSTVLIKIESLLRCLL